MPNYFVVCLFFSNCIYSLIFEDLDSNVVVQNFKNIENFQKERKEKIVKLRKAIAFFFF